MHNECMYYIAQGNNSGSKRKRRQLTPNVGSNIPDVLSSVATFASNSKGKQQAQVFPESSVHVRVPSKQIPGGTSPSVQGGSQDVLQECGWKGGSSESKASSTCIKTVHANESNIGALRSERYYNYNEDGEGGTIVPKSINEKVFGSSSSRPLSSRLPLLSPTQMQRLWRFIRTTAAIKRICNEPWHRDLRKQSREPETPRLRLFRQVVAASRDNRNGIGASCWFPDIPQPCLAYVTGPNNTDMEAIINHPGSVLRLEPQLEPPIVTSQCKSVYSFNLLEMMQGKAGDFGRFRGVTSWAETLKKERSAIVPYSPPPQAANTAMTMIPPKYMELAIKLAMAGLHHNIDVATATSGMPEVPCAKEQAGTRHEDSPEWQQHATAGNTGKSYDSERKALDAQQQEHLLPIPQQATASATRHFAPEGSDVHRGVELDKRAMPRDGNLVFTQTYCRKKQRLQPPDEARNDSTAHKSQPLETNNSVLGVARKTFSVEELDRNMKNTLQRVSTDDLDRKVPAKVQEISDTSLLQPSSGESPRKGGKKRKKRKKKRKKRSRSREKRRENAANGTDQPFASTSSSTPVRQNKKHQTSKEFSNARVYDELNKARTAQKKKAHKDHAATAALPQGMPHPVTHPRTIITHNSGQTQLPEGSESQSAARGGEVLLDYAPSQTTKSMHGINTRQELPSTGFNAKNTKPVPQQRKGTTIHPAAVNMDACQAKPKETFWKPARTQDAQPGLKEPNHGDPQEVGLWNYGMPMNGRQVVNLRPKAQSSKSKVPPSNIDHTKQGKPNGRPNLGSQSSTFQPWQQEEQKSCIYNDIAPVKLLCSEDFLETWSMLVSEMASGRWACSLAKEDELTQEKGANTFLTMSSLVLGRKIEMIDTQLVDLCDVDIELPNRCAAIVRTSSALEDVANTKRIVLGLARLAATGRYRRVYVFLCCDVDVTNNIARHIVQVIQLPQASLKMVSPISLSACLAQTVFSLCGESTDQGFEKFEMMANDTRTRERARFLLSLVPTLSAAGSFQCLQLTKKLEPHSPPFRLLMQSAPLRQRIMIAATSSSEQAAEIHPGAMEQLSRVLQVRL